MGLPVLVDIDSFLQVQHWENGNWSRQQDLVTGASSTSKLLTAANKKYIFY